MDVSEEVVSRVARNGGEVVREGRSYLASAKKTPTTP